MVSAVIKTGGKQYRVREKDTLLIEKLDLEPGSTAFFSEVLLVETAEGCKIGTPLVEGASVTGEVLEQTKGDKVIAYKFKRRKGYHRTVGHRQRLTRVRITNISH
ncbi:MAG: 50S ribosomal protein L21 [Chthoniobacterales bacterium]|nr:50S ribosomal protein L21 [Chthoniobacterales bacterium]MCX7712621.1 50S ribosomal protein L21 [Chthoniobacterales bacterium]